MRSDAFTHLRDEDLLHKLTSVLSRERMATAELLAVMAEVDARKLYVPEGYSSMFAYCVEKLHLSEGATARRIHAARAARQFPEIFAALAEGRLHLTAVFLLAPHLTEENAAQLLSAATHKRKVEIEALLARHFGRPEPPTFIRAIPASTAPPKENALDSLFAERRSDDGGEGGGSEVKSDEHTLEHVASSPMTDTSRGEPISRSEAPLPPARYLVQFSISKDTLVLLQHAQALLSHAVPKRDMEHVLQRALKALIPQLERQKFGAKRQVGESNPQSESARAAQSKSACKRHVPARVRRAVWDRDQGQCTFVAASGHRCNATSLLELDHVQPVACGGVATVEGMRLRCSAHNQYEAEQVFGANFMSRKRDEARNRARARGRAPTMSVQG